MSRCEHWRVSFELRRSETQGGGPRVEAIVVICTDCRTSWIGNKRRLS